MINVLPAFFLCLYIALFLAFLLSGDRSSLLYSVQKVEDCSVLENVMQSARVTRVYPSKIWNQSNVEKR